MLRHICLTLLLLFVVAGCGDSRDESKPESAGQGFVGPRELIPSGRITVDIMELVAPRRLVELTERLRQAALKNPEWMREQVKKSKPGEPLPYDSRMGLTEAEYDEFLAISNTMGMQPKSEAPLTFTGKENDVWVLDGGDTLPELTGIEIDLRNDLVRTPFGAAEQRSDISASSEQRATGPWNGVKWRMDSIGADGFSGTLVEFALGKLTVSGRGILYYDVKKVTAAERVRITHVLYYDLPSEP